MQSGVSCGLFTLVKLHHYQKSLHQQSGFLIILIQINTQSHLEPELWVVLNGFSLGVSPFWDESNENTFRSVWFSCCPASQTVPVKLREPYASHTEIKFWRTKARTWGRERDRLGVFGWDRWRDSLQKHRSLWESRHFKDSLWLSETERFLRRSILEPSPTLALKRTAF